MDVPNFLNEVSIVDVGPIASWLYGRVFAVAASALLVGTVPVVVGAHVGAARRLCRKFALIAVTVLVGDNERGKVKDHKEPVAEHADHARFVEKASEGEQGAIDTSADECPASESIDDGPLGALLAPEISVCGVEVRQKLISGLVIGEVVRSVDPVDVVVGRVHEVRLIEALNGGLIVLELQNV